nr:hypothetical protein [Tanacetum cinerariifolium]
MGAYKVNGTQPSVVVHDKDARIQKKSNGLVTLKKASKCKLWHLKKLNIDALGTVYKSDGKQMLHNQALPNDCYKVSIDSSLVDAACIPNIENKEIKADEEPPRGIMWLKRRVNKNGEFTDNDIRSVGDKLKEADDKIKKGTLNLDDGIDAITVVFGKEKGGYARGVGSGVTYKRNLLKLSDLRKCLSHEETGLKIPNCKEMCLQHKNYQQYESKCKLWHLKKSHIVSLGTVYKSDGKQMMHNQALRNDCYKVSIDSLLVDAACIPDVGNNGLKIVKDGVVSTRLIHIESFKSPTAVLFDVNTGRISIVTVNNKEYHSDVLARSQG